MPAIQSPTLADQARALVAEGAGRERQIHRLIDLHASSEAAAALQTSAATIREGGILSRALTAAAAVLADRGTSIDDAARERLCGAVTAPEFVSMLPRWIRELREIASSQPDSGACTVASALELWSWTMNYFRADEEGASRAADELSEALCPLLAARSLILEVATRKPDAGEVGLRSDIGHVFAARSAAAAGAACAELVFGYRRHPAWDAEGCGTCWDGGDLDELEALMPGIAFGARASSDVVEADGSHPVKRGPCARLDGVDAFMKLRNRLDGCLTGARIAKQRAAATIASSMSATGVGGRA